MQEAVATSQPVTPTPRTLKARDRLGFLLDSGKQKFANIGAMLDSQLPSDRVVAQGGVSFGYDGPHITARFNDGSQRLHRHALQQVGEEANVPWKFAQTLLQEQPDLLAETLERRLHRNDATMRRRRLVRSVNGEVRGYLSDKFRRLDSRPILGSMLEVATKKGVVPIDAQLTDTRVFLKVAYPELVEIPEINEVLIIGAVYQNSDFGDGALGLRDFIMRLVCLNGAIGEDGFRKIHLGARLGDDLAFSQKTYELDTATMASAVADITNKILDREEIKEKLTVIRTAATKEIDAPKEIDGLRRKALLTKEEANRVSELYRSAETVLLPPGNSAWRLSNVLSLFAQQLPEPDPVRSIELETLAGRVAGLSSDN